MASLQETRIRSGLHILNPDDRTLSYLKKAGYAGFQDAPPEKLRELFIRSAEEVEALLWKRINSGAPTGAETVLSSGKYRDAVTSVVQGGGQFYLIYVALSSPKLAIHRVAHRVTQKGHGVPEDKIRKRWRESLQELPWFLHRATVSWVFDNSGDSPQLVARCSHGVVEQFQSTFRDLQRALRRTSHLQGD